MWCIYSIDNVGRPSIVVIPELQGEQTSLSPSLQYKILWALSVDLKNSIGFTDSFHNGTDNPGAFDTGLTRLFSIATIELEYNFPKIATAAV